MKPDSLKGAGRGRRRRLLPRPRDGPGLGQGLRRPRARGRAQLRPDHEAEGVDRVGLPGRPGREPLVEAPEEPRRRRRKILGEEGPASPTSARRWWWARGASPTGRCATWCEAAGDDRPLVAEHPDPAGGRRRRGRLPLAAPRSRSPAAREVQIGGPDVLSYSDMLDRMAWRWAAGRVPSCRCRCCSPYLSSQWIGLVTPVDAGVAKPLVEGLSTETVVTDPGRGAVRHRPDGHRRRAPQGIATRRTADTLRCRPRAVAQPGSALRSGRRGPQFKSGQPDFNPQLHGHARPCRPAQR